jgi:hypothetical protein
MRIISEHKDYYDCMMAQGMDLTCVWVRRLEEVEYKGNLSWPFPVYKGATYYRRNYDIYIYEHVIGFCGKIYPVLEVSVPGISWIDEKPTFCHNLAEVDAFVESHYDKKQIDSYRNPKKYSWRDKNNIGATHNVLAKFFEDFKLAENNYEKIFIDNGCPVFVAQYRPRWNKESSIVYHGRREDSERPDDDPTVVKRTNNCGNVVLKDFEFFRIFDPPQAFQEVWQYISGILGLNNPHVPEMDDKTKRDGHGFNDWSFKKEPSKKRG